MKLHTWFLQAALLTFVAVAMGGVAYGQTYSSARSRSPIVVDGVFDEPDWQTARWASLQENHTGGDPRMQSRFAILWDPDHLFIAYDFKDRNILASIPTRDARLWIQDVAEIFLTPLESDRVYYEFQFSPLENWRDVVILHRESDARIQALPEWDANVRIKARVTGTLENNQDQDEGWQLEVAIPFRDLWLAPHLPPLPGDRWRINLFRIDYGLETVELAAWNPTNGDSFHVPSKFGTLLFR